MHLIIALALPLTMSARDTDFSNSRVYSRDFFAVKTDESRGSLDAMIRYVASTRTLDRKFHVDSLRESVRVSVMK